MKNERIDFYAAVPIPLSERSRDRNAPPGSGIERRVPVRVMRGLNGEPVPFHNYGQSAGRDTNILPDESTQVTYPTLISPWYVVQRHVDKYCCCVIDDPSDFPVGTEKEYWTTDGEGAGTWATNPHQAMLFMNLHNAARVADAEHAEVRVIYNKDGLREFRPREFE